MNARVLGLITARGGSKGLPRKSIRELGGKPLIAWSIEAALQSNAIDRLVVSTDDKEIAAVSREFGAEVPFLRPIELAGDHSPHIDTVVHALEWLSANDHYRPDYVLLLQPTMPLRTAADIDAANEVALHYAADSVVGMREAPCHPWLMFTAREDGTLCDYAGVPKEQLRRQDYPCVYAINGAIYLTRRDVIIRDRTWYPPRTFPYVMPADRSIDIDNEWDLHMAEAALLYRSQEGRKCKSSSISPQHGEYQCQYE